MFDLTSKFELADLISKLPDWVFELVDFVVELPTEVVALIALLTIGLIISIIKKTLKLTIIIISILILLFALHKLANYFQIDF